MRRFNPTPTEIVLLISAILFCTFWGLHYATLLTYSNLDVPANLVYAGKHVLGHMLHHPKDIRLTQDTFPIALVCLVAPLAIFLNAQFKKGNFRPGEEHGSAKWLTLKQVRNYKDAKDEENNIILSKHARLRLGGNAKDPEYQRNNNLLIIGNPGTGKTRFIVKPNLMQLNCSYVITDPKGSLFPETGWLFEEAGYRVYLLDTIHPERSMQFNPFAFVRENTPEHPDAQYTDLFNIMQTLWTNLSEKNPNAPTDPFWEDSAQALLTSIALFMFEITEDCPEKRNFRFLMELIGALEFQEGKQSPFDVMIELWESGEIPDNLSSENRVSLPPQIEEICRSFKPMKHPDSLAVRMYKNNRKGAEKTLQSIFSTINKSTWKFELDEVLKLTDRNDFDLRHVGGYAPDDLKEALKTNPSLKNPGLGYPCGKVEGIAPHGQQKTVIFLCMKDKNKFYSFLIALFEAILIDQLLDYADSECPKHELPIPVQFWLDEFANIGKINDFEIVLNTLRSRNIGCSIVLQMIAQLDKVYGKESRGLFEGGCDTHICLGTTDWETCKYISEVSGKSTVDVRSLNKSYGQQRSYSLGEQMHERYLLTPDEVRGLKRSKTLVMFTDGMYKDDKYDIATHNRYSLIDPGHKNAKYQDGYTSEAIIAKRNNERAMKDFFDASDGDAEVIPEEKLSLFQKLLYSISSEEEIQEDLERKEKKETQE